MPHRRTKNSPYAAHKGRWVKRGRRGKRVVFVPWNTPKSLTQPHPPQRTRLRDTGVYERLPDGSYAMLDPDKLNT